MSRQGGSSREEKRQLYGNMGKRQTSHLPFIKLTDQSKINVKPDRIRIKNAKRSGTLKSVLQSYNMKNDRLEEIALLNGMKLTDQIKTGTMIKVIEK